MDQNGGTIPMGNVFIIRMPMDMNGGMNMMPMGIIFTANFPMAMNIGMISTGA